MSVLDFTLEIFRKKILNLKFYHVLSLYCDMTLKINIDQHNENKKQNDMYKQIMLQ